MIFEDMHSVQRINFSECLHWHMDGYSLFHTSRRYFSVIAVKHFGHEHIMINQPEVGLLGYVVAKEADTNYWLVQDKREPGNKNLSQVAPSVQATKSNSERVHGGRSTPYLDMFHKSYPLDFDVENSEQGDRFLNKFNRNAKRLVRERFSINEDLQHQYRWVESSEICDLLRRDYAVNTDARSVITSGGWQLLCNQPEEIFLNNDLPRLLATSLNHTFIHRDRVRTSTLHKPLEDGFESRVAESAMVPLSLIKQHRIEADGIYDRDNQRVIGYYDVYMPEREISRWQQPLLEQSETAHCVLLMRVVDGIAEIGVKAYPEIGFRGRSEYGPTLQTGTGTNKLTPDRIEGLLENAIVLLEIYQSDEGGRFYQNICRYTLAYLENARTDIDERVYWFSAYEIEIMSHRQGFLSNELRTCLSLLLSFA